MQLYCNNIVIDMKQILFVLVLFLLSLVYTGIVGFKSSWEPLVLL